VVRILTAASATRKPPDAHAVAKGGVRGPDAVRGVNCRDQRYKQAAPAAVRGGDRAAGAVLSISFGGATASSLDALTWRPTDFAKRRTIVLE